MLNCIVYIYDLNDIEKLNVEIVISDIFVNVIFVGMYLNEYEIFISDIFVFRKEFIVVDIIYNFKKM